MGFNLLSGIKPPKTPEMARKFFHDIQKGYLAQFGITLEGNINELSDADVIDAASKIYFALSQVPIMDNPEGSA